MDVVFPLLPSQQKGKRNVKLSVLCASAVNQPVWENTYED